MTHPFWKESRIGSIGDFLRHAVETFLVRTHFFYARKITFVAGPIDWDRTQVTNQRPDQGPAEKAMAGTENNLSGEVSDYQSRVDQSIRVSRDEQSSAVEW
jgi:DNA primase